MFVNLKRNRRLDIVDSQAGARNQVTECAGPGEIGCIAKRNVEAETKPPWRLCHPEVRRRIEMRDGRHRVHLCARTPSLQARVWKGHVHSRRDFGSLQLCQARRIVIDCRCVIRLGDESFALPRGARVLIRVVEPKPKHGGNRKSANRYQCHRADHHLHVLFHRSVLLHCAVWPPITRLRIHNQQWLCHGRKSMEPRCKSP